MTAINNLAKTAYAITRNSLQSLEDTVNEIAEESTIQTLIDIVLDLQHQLSDLIMLQIAFELPAAEGNAETREKYDGRPYTHEISDYAINIGPINIYSMAGVLADTISEFETQTAVITSMFSLLPLSDTSRIFTTWNGVLPLSTVSAEPGTLFLPSDRTFFFETLYAADSAFLIREMETIRSKMAAVPVEKNGDIPETVPDTRILPIHAVQTILRSGIFKEAFSQYAAIFSEIVHDISPAVQTGILKASEAADISQLVTIVMKALSAPELSSELSRSSVARTTELSSVRGATEISTMKAFTAISPPAASSPTGGIKPEVIPGQRRIEIPTFMLHKKILSSENESAINAVALSEAVSQGFTSDSTTASFTRHNQTPSLTEILTIPFSAVSVSSALETIYSSIITATALDNQITEMLREKEENLFTQYSLVDLLNGGAVTQLFLARTVSGEYGGSNGAELTSGLAAALSLVHEGAAVINDSILAASYTQEYRAIPAAALPGAMQNSMLLYGSPHETISGLPRESRNHFQNTFNITIDMKGGGEEHELRELGKKIGAILSEEIKRYGVIR